MQSPRLRPGGILGWLLLAAVAFMFVGAIATAAWAVFGIARSGGVQRILSAATTPSPAGPPPPSASASSEAAPAHVPSPSPPAATARPPAVRPDTQRPSQAQVAEAQRRLAALGLTADVENLIASTARHELEQVELLLQAGISPNAKDGDMSAWQLVMIGLDSDPVNETIALKMLAAGADLGYRTPTRMGPLPLAVSACRLKLVEALLRAGAEPNAQDGHGLTPMRWAQQSCPAAVLPLRRAGAR